ncbi:MAG: dihydrolipoamide acetyltransferase family protein [Anaerolineales bacterium]|jgi:pyruvate dehydrogenase E2 component (dihydrolipoamide acetyltransferase)
MPALGMAQETGRLIDWLKQEGEQVTQGEPIMEIETDKVTVEIEAPASGLLRGVSASKGDDVPVGQTIAWILDPKESLPESSLPHSPGRPISTQGGTPAASVVSPVARKIAEEHQIDLSQIKSDGGRIQKADVINYLERQKTGEMTTYRVPASPKARRLAAEIGLDIASLNGSGPNGAVLAADVLAAQTPTAASAPPPESSTWQIMAERVTQSWASVPHFYLMRELNASRLVAWLDSARQRIDTKLTYTDLLVKLVATALQQHPRSNASWEQNRIVHKPDINIGLAVAVEDGLVVPVIHRANQLGLQELAGRRIELVQRAQSHKLSLEDIQEGTFTISNLGMYGVDSFNAIVNAPQAAILAVGRIAERAVPINGQLGIQPMMTINLSCDHRVIDGARGAQFLQTLTALIEEPLGLLD